MRAPPDSQGDLFPRCAPPTVLLHLARAARAVQRMSPWLSPDHCHALLGELALLELRLERLQHQHETAERFTTVPTPAPSPSSSPSMTPPWMHGPNVPAWSARVSAER